MFESLDEQLDKGLAALAVLADPDTSMIDRLRASVRLARVADAVQAQALAGLADASG